MRMYEIYEQIAKKYGVTVEEVRRDMQSAITYAFASPKDMPTKQAQESVPSTGEIPSNEEFITYCAQQVEWNINVFPFVQ